MPTAKFYTPTVTAWTADRRLDIPGNRAVLEHAVHGGMDGVVVLGSTGEFPMMREEDKLRLIDLAVEYRDAAEVIVGTAGATVEDTIRLSNHALAAGAHAVMVVGPWYYGLDDAAVESYFDAVATGVDGPLYLYNFPDRTTYPISADVVVNLARQHANVVGLKDTVTGPAPTRSVLRAFGTDLGGFRVLAGFDENLARVVASGGIGAIGGLSNVYPEPCARYASAVAADDGRATARWQKVIDHLMSLYTVAPVFIPVLKEAMILRGVPIQSVSLAPLQPPTAAQRERIQEILDGADALIADASREDAP